MQTLIVYGSKHGFTRKISRMLENLVLGSKAVDLADSGSIDFASLDRIIIGGPIYNGRVLPRVRRFCRRNLQDLLNKEVAIFIVGISGLDALEVYWEESFPEDLRKHSTTHGLLGGMINAGNLSFLERVVVRGVKKIAGNLDLYDEADLEAFAVRLKGSDFRAGGRI